MDEKRQFSEVLEENEALLKRAFSGDDTFILRALRTRGGKALFIAYFDGMVDAQVIDLHIVRAVQALSRVESLEALLESTVSTEQAKIEHDPGKAFLSMEAGDTILCADGFAGALVLSTKGFKTRAVEEPDTEKYLRGPKEGFTESLMLNTTLLRRRLLTPKLRIEMHEPVSGAGVRYALCYLEDKAEPYCLSRLRKKLENLAPLPALLSENDLEERISRPFSLFKTVGVTEKPDIAAAKLLEGRAVILCEGSPNALTAPFLFYEYFQAGTDYYGNFWFGSVLRLLRIFGTFLSIATPAIYISLICFHQEMLPTPLLLSIAKAREGVPFSPVFETFLMLIAFELLRDAGLMMPQGIGNALSTVGGVVIGQAAVDARFISAPLVIVIAFTGLTDLLIPKLKGPVFFMRLYLLALSALVGICGCILGAAGILALLVSMESFGIPYTSLLDTPSLGGGKDTIVRAPLWMLGRKRAGIE